MSEQHELRVFECELRAAQTDAGRPELAGEAVVYNRMSQDLGGFREVFAPGSLADAAQSAELAALWQHDPAYVLGRVRSGTLRVADTAEALRFEVEPPETQWARDAMTSIQRGDVSQMSFGFSVAADGEEWQMADGMPLRIVRRAQLWEISPVTFPAYRQTSVELQKRAAELRAQFTATAEPEQPEEQAQERLLRERLRFDLLGMEVDA